MRFVLPGGSGQVGTLLARALTGQGHDVVVLSRGAPTGPWRVVTWDGKTAGAWAEELEGADAVINLAGRSVNCRYTPRNRDEILRSRVDSTLAVGTAIARSRRPPRVWLQASTATIYSHRCDAPNDDITGILGGNEPDVPSTWRFSIEVARAWEAASIATPTPHTRLVLLRSAMTMSPDRGGIFDTLVTLARRGLGGTAASGRQYVSWIHEADFVAAVLWLMHHDDLEGAVNVAAPHPLPNSEFMRILRQACGARFGLPAAAWMLEAGARLMGTETELILKSRRVEPARLLRSGFEFTYPDWPRAAAELSARRNSLR